MLYIAVTSRLDFNEIYEGYDPSISKKSNQHLWTLVCLPKLERIFLHSFWFMHETVEVKGKAFQLPQKVGVKPHKHSFLLCK